MFNGGKDWSKGTLSLTIDEGANWCGLGGMVILLKLSQFIAVPLEDI